jgi:hypothetical protein
MPQVITIGLDPEVARLRQQFLLEQMVLGARAKNLEAELKARRNEQRAASLQQALTAPLEALGQLGMMRLKEQQEQRAAAAHAARQAAVRIKVERERSRLKAQQQAEQYDFVLSRDQEMQLAKLRDARHNLQDNFEANDPAALAAIQQITQQEQDILANPSAMVKRQPSPMEMFQRSTIDLRTLPGMQDWPVPAFLSFDEKGSTRLHELSPPKPPTAAGGLTDTDYRSIQKQAREDWEAMHQPAIESGELDAVPPMPVEWLNDYTQRQQYYYRTGEMPPPSPNVLRGAQPPAAASSPAGPAPPGPGSATAPAAPSTADMIARVNELMVKDQDEPLTPQEESELERLVAQLELIYGRGLQPAGAR